MTDKPPPGTILEDLWTELEIWHCYAYLPEQIERSAFGADTPECTLKNIAAVLQTLLEFEERTEGHRTQWTQADNGVELILNALAQTALDVSEHMDGMRARIREEREKSLQ